MLKAEEYIQTLTEYLKTEYKERLVYIGLQGSYLRGEATENSDIDIMVVIRDITVADLEAYRNIILRLPDYDKSCGFICGKEELLNWNPLEICHLLHTTVDYFGELRPLLPSYTNEDVENYIKLSVGNLYHEICHRYLHTSDDTNAAEIAGSYKSVFFILQNACYLKTGIFPQSKKELLALTSCADRDIFSKVMALDNGTTYEFVDLFTSLLNWCSDLLNR